MKPNFTLNEIDSVDHLHAASVLLTIADMAYGRQSGGEQVEQAKAILHELLTITPYINFDIVETIFSSGQSDRAIDAAYEVAAFLTPAAIQDRARGFLAFESWKKNGLNLTVHNAPFLSII